MNPSSSKGPFITQIQFRRLVVGVGLMAVSIWGFFYCRRLMSGYLPSGDYTIDRSFGWMGAWASWFVIFFPLFLAGAWLFYSTVRKMDFENEWRSRRQEKRRSSGGVFEAEVVSMGSEHLRNAPRGVETLSDEEAARLQKGAARAADILGVTVGMLLAGFGALGLSYFLFFTPPYTGLAPYAERAIDRGNIRLAVLCGMSLFAGLVVLLRTFAKPETTWLIPLRIFNRVALFRARAAEKSEEPTTSASNPRRLG